MIKKYRLLVFVLLLAGSGYFYFFIDFNQFRLGVLTTLKTMKGQSVDLSEMHTIEGKHDHTIWTSLLKKHVSLEGNVDYAGFITDRLLLAQYLDHLSVGPPSLGSSDEEQIAYWINAYNAFTIQLIIDHWPLNSIRDIGGNIPMIDSPWSIKFFKIGGVDFDLDTIEHEILRKKFDEPRIHFAIVCASKSCPRLLNQAFTPDLLEQQLESQARAFVNDPSKNRITSDGLALSQIFDWFKTDFTKEGSLKEYIQPYTQEDLSDRDINFTDYDWSLNM